MVIVVQSERQRIVMRVSSNKMIFEEAIFQRSCHNELHGLEEHLKNPDFY